MDITSGRRSLEGMEGTSGFILVHVEGSTRGWVRVGRHHSIANGLAESRKISVLGSVRPRDAVRTSVHRAHGAAKKVRDLDAR